MERHAVNTDVPAVARLQQRALAIGVVGLLAGIAGAFMVSSDQFFRSWLIGFLFCLGLSMGSLALLMLQHLSGGQWGLVGRRVFEAASRTLPLVALAFVPLVFGLPKLFIWADPAAAGDAIIQAKAPYLNVRFFLGRAVFYFAVWMFISFLLNRWSARQDRGEIATAPADTRRFRAVSAPGLLAYVILMSFASVDWIMSLDPHWYSTIFGFILVAGQGLAAFSLVIVVLSMLTDAHPMSTYLSQRHFIDLGKLLLAFVMLWAYFSFSQFLVIWAGNLPEEIPFFLNRLQHGWQYVSLLLVVGHFALPFTLLLSRDLKRKSGLLASIAAFILLMRYVDLLWLVNPMFSHGDAGAHRFPIHWMDVAIPAGLIGLWFFVFARQLRSRSLLPLNDPFFKEAFVHEAR
jgi:hypothetical protein